MCDVLDQSFHPLGIDERTFAPESTRPYSSSAPVHQAFNRGTMARQAPRP